MFPRSFSSMQVGIMKHGSLLGETAISRAFCFHVEVFLESNFPVSFSILDSFLWQRMTQPGEFGKRDRTTSFSFSLCLLCTSALLPQSARIWGLFLPAFGGSVKQPCTAFAWRCVCSGESTKMPGKIVGLKAQSPICFVRKKWYLV